MAAAAGSGDLARRLGVAAVGIPLAVAVTWAGGLAFALGLSFLAVVSAWEYARMVERRSVRLPLALAAGGAALFPPVVLYLGPSGAWLAAVLLLFAASAYGMMRRTPAEGPIRTAAATAFGALYLGGLLSFGVPLRETLVPADRLGGTLLFFLPVVVTWGADTAAYFGGRAFGRRRLAPIVSPNKTLEGAAAAVAAATLCTVAYGHLLSPVARRVGTDGLAVLGLLLGAAAVLGDLVESALKRECAVKDASGLLPGHGGVLDRLDSLLWSIPVAYLFLAGGV